jgi:hypothetical protein
MSNRQTLRFIVDIVLQQKLVKLDLVTIQCNLTGDEYIRDVLQPVFVPHFDNHPLATRPVYMDDNARPHRLTNVLHRRSPILYTMA